MPGFRDPDLAHRVEALSAEALDGFPFGVIRLSADGHVVLFNATERSQSGYKGRPAIGLNFFTQIAPCMDTPEMRGRIEAARARGTVDIEVGWIGDFADRTREMTIRVQSASDGGLWVFLTREDLPA
jgi:photoactive yellow protein